MLTVREWAEERLQTVGEIAALKSAPDRAGWLEDQRYWRAICAQLDELAALKKTAEGQSIAWQPMETAPKDGTRILLAWGGKTMEGWWQDNSVTKYPWAGWKIDSLRVTPHREQPTRWMPLPTPPSEP